MLPEVNGPHARRAVRIRLLHRKIVALAKESKLKVRLITGPQVRIQLLGCAKGTKFALATTLAAKFPVELASRLPPKRRPWMSEDPRMDIFDAVGLAAAFWTNDK